MRLWSLHPSLLDRMALVAVWREGLLAQKVLRGMTKGYKHHPQLRRFRETPQPVEAIGTYLSGIADEAHARDYRLIAAGSLPRARPRFRLPRGSSSTSLNISSENYGCEIGRN